MPADDPVVLAAAWVWARFPVVPPVGAVYDFSERAVAELQRQAPGQLTAEEARQVQGKWFISFFCSWDTDALGLPMTLNLLVDCATGAVEQV
jgi:hypothetical protein